MEIIKTYIVLAQRNMLKNKIFSSINIVGFAIGMACVFLIALWINDEMKYDAFNKNGDTIYRVTTFYNKYKWEGLALTPAPLAPLAEKELPEIVNAARVYPCPAITMKMDDKIFYERNGIFADPSFLNMFSFQLIDGSIKGILENPLSILITRELSSKYFGNENPLGKTLICDGNPYLIEGVLEDIPYNSHLQFEFIVPFKLLGNLPWGNMSFQTYIQLNENANSSSVAGKLGELAKRNTPQIQDGAWFELQKLEDVYLDASNKKSYTVTGNINNIYLFSAIAILVLCIACFNFINLATAKSESRNKEIGIRKLIGANRHQLRYQFLIETTLLTFLSLCIALGISKLSLPYFNNLVNKDLVINLANARLLLTLVVVSSVIGLLSGIYPAVYLSALNPLSIRKNKLSIFNEKQNDLVSTKKALVVMQFCFSIVLIVSVLVINNQFNYIKNKDLGFNKEEVIYIPLKNQIASQYKTFKAELLKQSNIHSVSAQNYLSASINRRTTNYDWETKEEGESVDMLVAQVDYDYFKTIQLDIIDGRTFSTDFGNEQAQAFVVNEAAIQAMGIDNPIGKYFSYNNKKGNIVGIAKNAHLASLHKSIEPQVFHLINDYSSISNYGVILIRINMKSADKALRDIEAIYSELCRNDPFEYHFLDQVYGNLYKTEERTGKIISSFTLLAIIISCLGLFGLTEISTKRKIKEIGIRKVNGAKVSEILRMLNKDFVKWVAIAFIIACPIAWYTMNKWLESFAYKTNLSWWIFAMAGVLVLGIALLTVSWQSWQAATRNPVDALRYE